MNLSFRLYSKPQYTPAELKQRLTGVNDAFQMVESDISKFLTRTMGFSTSQWIISFLPLSGTLSGGIKELLGSDHPVLESCAKYFFESDGGKKIRPTMVLAISYALNSQPSAVAKQQSSSTEASLVKATPSQKRLAEITEMIHTASLFHDDVIDKATTRRNMSSVNQVPHHTCNIYLSWPCLDLVLISNYVSSSAKESAVFNA